LGLEVLVINLVINLEVVTVMIKDGLAALQTQSESSNTVCVHKSQSVYSLTFVV